MDPAVLLLIPLGVGLVGLAIIAVLYYVIKREEPGTERMREIASFIEQGADAFLKREFKTIAYFIVVIAAILLACFRLKWQIAFAFTAAFMPRKTARRMAAMTTMK